MIPKRPNIDLEAWKNSKDPEETSELEEEPQKPAAKTVEELEARLKAKQPRYLFDPRRGNIPDIRDKRVDLLNFWLPKPKRYSMKTLKTLYHENQSEWVEQIALRELHQNFCQDLTVAVGELMAGTSWKKQANDLLKQKNPEMILFRFRANFLASFLEKRFEYYPQNFTLGQEVLTEKVPSDEDYRDLAFYTFKMAWVLVHWVEEQKGLDFKIDWDFLAVAFEEEEEFVKNQREKGA